MLDEELDGTNALIAPAIFKEGKGYLVDALHIEDFRALLFQNIVGSIEGTHQRLTFDINEEIRCVKYESSRFMSGEQSNTSIIYNERFVLKIFRRIFSDPNPDFEVNRFLTEAAKFENCQSTVARLNIPVRSETVTLALMQDLVENQGDAWSFSQVNWSQLLSVWRRKSQHFSPLPKNPEFNRLPVKDVPSVFVDWTGLKLYEQIEKLAQRTAQMHTALGSTPSLPPLRRPHSTVTMMFG